MHAAGPQRVMAGGVTCVLGLSDPLHEMGEIPLARFKRVGQSGANHPVGSFMRPWHDVAGRTKRWARARLSRRLLAWFLVFSLVPLVVTNAVGYARSKAIIRRRIERDQAALAEVQAL